MTPAYRSNLSRGDGLDVPSWSLARRCGAVQKESQLTFHWMKVRRRKAFVAAKELFEYGSLARASNEKCDFAAAFEGRIGQRDTRLGLGPDHCTGPMRSFLQDGRTGKQRCNM